MVVKEPASSISAPNSTSWPFLAKVSGQLKTKGVNSRIIGVVADGG
jgi:hypothetical protein